MAMEPPPLPPKPPRFRGLKIFLIALLVIAFAGIALIQWEIDLPVLFGGVGETGVE